MEKTWISKEEYNLEPVYYCTKCKSLKIRGVDDIEGTEYCEECGSTEIATSTIDQWEELYKTTYGHRYLDEKSKIIRNW